MKPSLKKLFDRRELLKNSGNAAAGISLASFFASSEDVEAAMQNVKRASKPSELKITDMRVAVLTKCPMTCPIIRIDTNQDIYGLGEVRDFADKNYALMLKSRILGENPCNVEKLFRRIKQFGGHARQEDDVPALDLVSIVIVGAPVAQRSGILAHNGLL